MNDFVFFQTTLTPLLTLEKQPHYLLFKAIINGLTILFKSTVILLLRKIYPTKLILPKGMKYLLKRQKKI
jgi:hypothetical protein